MIDQKIFITYQVADLSQPLPAYQEHFDLIASFFVLNDVSDYRGFLSTLASVLKRGATMMRGTRERLRHWCPS